MILVGSELDALMLKRRLAELLLVALGVVGCSSSGEADLGKPPLRRGFSMVGVDGLEPPTFFLVREAL